MFISSLICSLVPHCKNGNKLKLLHSQKQLSIVGKSAVGSYFSTHSMGDSIAENRKMYLEMPINEKRALYKCGSKFTTLQTVDTWASTFSKMEATQKLNESAIKSFTDFGPFSVNTKLCEKVAMWEGDITALEIDSIVNAANESLLGGGGVDGAIHRAAGPELKAECKTLNGCLTGEAKVTGGYKLPAKYVIHTVGPRGEKPDLLKKCYQNSLDLVVKNNLRSVAFPCISTGIYGYPQESAAKVALTAVRSFLDEHSDSVDRVIFCLFLKEDIEIYSRLMQVAFPCGSV